ncbi:uncharacterized protein [Macrobrachium rosenbergii]|uniref:uncharacterized protein n=1 Tax=Macrobrachium rosenbergii TaxID=79674 RepID=UPI0034D69FCE
MKFLLATLALLPVIASHMFLQLPPLSASSSSTGRHMPLGLRQYSHQGPGSSMKGLRQQPQPEEEPTLIGDSQYSQSEEQSSTQQRLRQKGRQLQAPQDSRSSDGQDLGGDWNAVYQSSLEPRVEALPESKRSADYELAVRIPEGFDDAMGRQEGGSSSPLLNYLLPSLQNTLSSRSLSSYPSRFFNGLSHQRRSSAPMASSQRRYGGSLPEGAKKTPAKRYLGIELPDYIASNYGADKTSNTKLHNLKQRMRSVGK